MTEPDRLIAGLEDHVLQQGAEVHHGCTVERILASDSECLGVVLEDGEVVEGGQVVLAAGIWSDGLARHHGIRVPMQPAKGYHVMVDVQQPPSLACVCRESMLAVNSMDHGVRLAGTLELSGINHRMAQRRLDLLVKGASRCVKGIEDAPILHAWTGQTGLCSDCQASQVSRSRARVGWCVAPGCVKKSQMSVYTVIVWIG